MTSLYLNSCPSSFPVPDLNQDQNLPHHLFSNSFLINNTTHQFQTEFLPNFADLHHDQEVVDYISESRLRDPKPSSSSFQEAINQSRESPKRDEDEGIMNNSRGMEGSAKWIPSKMRIMQKMINSNASSEDNHHKPFKYTLRFQDHHTNYNESNNSSSQSIRVCSDCNTTTTPLWRSGPKGPKSLCNACGIRQRKARRAMAAAEAAVGNGTGVAAETKPSNKVHNMKEKKLRTAHVTHCKKLCKSPPPPHHHHHHHPSLPPHKPKISFKNFAFNLSNTNNSALHPVFPQDVEQAAILLMELSCGFVHV